MRHGRAAPTVTSLAPSDAKFVPFGERERGGGPGKPVRVVDWPGHQRLCGYGSSQLLPDFGAALARAAGVVFVVDAVELLRDDDRLTSVAEFLYSLFVECIRTKRAPDILVACNKTDLRDEEEDSDDEEESDGGEGGDDGDDAAGGKVSRRDAATARAVRAALEGELDQLKDTRNQLATEGADGADGAAEAEVLLGTEGEPFSFEADAGVDVSFCCLTAEKGGAGVDRVEAFVRRVAP